MSDIVDVAELELLVAAQERTLQGQEAAGLSLDHVRRQLQKARPQSSTIKWRRFLEDTLIENGKKIKERQSRTPPSPSIEMSDPGIELAPSEAATTRLHDPTLKSTPKPEASSGVVLPSGQPLVINVQAPPPAPSPPGNLNGTGELTLLQTAELEVLRRALLGGAQSLLTAAPPRDATEAAAKTDREERLEKQVEELGHLARTQQRLLEQLMARIQEMSEDQHKLRHGHRHRHARRHGRRRGDDDDANSHSQGSDSGGEDSPDSLRPSSPVRDLIDYDEIPLPTQRRVDRPADPDESPPLKQNLPAKVVYRNNSMEMSIPSSSRFLTLNERCTQLTGGTAAAAAAGNTSEFEESPAVGKSEAVKEESTDQLISLDPEGSEATPGGTSDGTPPLTGSLDRIPEEEGSPDDDDNGAGLGFHSPTKIVVNPGRKTPSFKFTDETSEVRDSDDISEVQLHAASCSSSLGDPWTANFGSGLERGSRSTLEELIAEGESLLMSSGEQKAHANLVRATPVFGSGRSSASISIEMRNPHRRSGCGLLGDQVKTEDDEELLSLVLQARRSLGLEKNPVDDDVITNERALQSAAAAGLSNGCLSGGNHGRAERKQLTARMPVSAVSLDDKENDGGGSANLSVPGRDSGENNVLVLAAWRPPQDTRLGARSTSEAPKAPVQVDDESLLRLQGSPSPVWEEPYALVANEQLAITDKEPVLSSPSMESIPAKSPDYLTGDEFPFGNPRNEPTPGSSPSSSGFTTIESSSRYTHVVALRPRQEGSSKSPARYSGHPRRFRDLASARKSQHEASVHSRTSAEWSRVMENRLKHAKEEWAMIAGRSSPVDST
ncbi:hypothetical protein FOL47_000309 [Perkinsus chesapeaki]|uniref:Uncharacterized protein n=1 Tax=Perkinsus chesapeaki TaxID=330153 RepID=A0A7J6MNR8_PERCH|nr:hypothetical protein FOL47_000309 [Perkinsus chesapeaki]